MLVAFQVMTRVQVAIDALEPKLFGILIIVQVCRSAFFCDSLGIKVLMAFHTRFVKHKMDCIFQLPFTLPVKGGTVLEMKGEEVVESGPDLCPEMPEGSMGREVAFHTSCPDPTLVLVMYGSGPVEICFDVDVAGLAIFVVAGLDNHLINAQDHTGSQEDSGYEKNPVPSLFRRSVSHISGMYQGCSPLRSASC
jgi:hypothetical protein